MIVLVMPYQYHEGIMIESLSIIYIHKKKRKCLILKKKLQRYIFHESLQPSETFFYDVTAQKINRFSCKGILDMFIKLKEKNFKRRIALKVLSCS